MSINKNTLGVLVVIYELSLIGFLFLGSLTFAMLVFLFSLPIFINVPVAEYLAIKQFINPYLFFSWISTASCLITGSILRPIIEFAIYKDFNNRKWADKIKRDLWEKLFSHSGFFGYALGVSKIIYYWMIIKDNMSSYWWHEKKKSFWFRVLYTKNLLNFLSIFNKIYSYLYFTLFALMIIIFFISFYFSLNALILFLIFDILFSVLLLIIVPLVGLFQVSILIHITSKKWNDDGYKVFFPMVPLKLYGSRSIIRFKFSDYYNLILKEDLKRYD